MRNSLTTKIIAGIICGLFTLQSAVQAEDGLIIEQNMEITGMPGQPPMNTTQKIWLTPEKMRMEMKGGAKMPGMGDMTTIMRGDLNKVFMLDDSSKSYMEMPADFATPGMPEGMEFKTEVKATGQSKKINQWNCEEYIITTSCGPFNFKVIMWTTKDVKFDNKLRDKMLEAGARNPMMKPLTDKLRDIEGFPVEQNIEMDMGGMKMTTINRVTSVVEQKITDEIFEVPEGYSKREMAL